MAKRFLTHVDLTGNQILNASFEKLAAAPGSGNFEGRMYYDTVLNIVRVYIDSAWIDSGIPIVASDPASDNYEGRIIYNTTADTIKYYNGITWNSVGAGSITSVSGTAGEVDVSTVGSAVTISLPTNISANASSADKWSTSRTVTFGGGDVTGSFSIDGSTDVSNVNLSIAANSVALGTDTTGDYVATISGTANQVNVTGSGEGATITLSTPQDIHTGANPTFAGVNAGNINVGITSDNEIDTDSGNLTIDSAGGTTTVDDNLIVTGDLTVQGTTTTLETQTLNVEDNIITLNYGVTGTPSLNAGIEVERGDLANVVFRWNETSDTWELTRDGTNYEEVATYGSAFTEAAQDAVGAMLVDGTTIDFTYTDSTPALTAEVKLATTSYLATTGGLAVDKSTLETALVTDGFTKKFSYTAVADSVTTSFNVDHNLNTKDVIVQVYDNDTFDTVECDVVRSTVNRVVVSFSVAPTTGSDYRVVVIG